MNNEIMLLTEEEIGLLNGFSIDCRLEDCYDCNQSVKCDLYFVEEMEYDYA